MQDIPEFRSYYKPQALIRYGVTGIVISPLILWWGWDSLHAPIKTLRDYTGIYLGIPFALFMLGFALVAFVTLTSKEPALEITEEGISFKSLARTKKRVFWSEVGGFSIRDSPVGRDSTETLIDVFANAQTRQVLISIPVKDLSMPDNKELALPVQTVIDALEMYAAQREQGNVIEVTDKRVTPAPQTGVQKVLAWVLGVLLTVTFSTVGRVVCRQANTSLVRSQQQQYIDEVMERMEREPMMQAIKQVEPEEYDTFQRSLWNALDSSKSQLEMEVIASDFGTEITQKRLRHATPSTLREYAKCRLAHFENIGRVSPEVLYQLLMTNKFQVDDLPSPVKDAMQREQKNISEQLARIIVAPLSSSAIPQDEAVVNKQVQAVVSKLTDAERLALSNVNKPDVNHEDFNSAILHLYRETLELPDTECVQVFRSFNQLPLDDRDW